MWVLEQTFLAFTHAFLIIREEIDTNHRQKNQTSTTVNDLGTEIERKLGYVTQYNSKAYFKSALKKVFLANPDTVQYVIIL